MNNEKYFLKCNYSCQLCILLSHVNKRDEQPHCVLHQCWFRAERAQIWFHFTKEKIHCPRCSNSVFSKSCQQSHTHLKHIWTPQFHHDISHKPHLCAFTTSEVKTGKNVYHGKEAVLRSVVYTFNTISLLKNTKERDHLIALGTDKKIMLKQILQK